MNPPPTPPVVRPSLPGVLLRVLPAIPMLLVVLLPPAGTWAFWQGWAYVGGYCANMVIFVSYYYRRDPALLARRMLRKETVGQQKVIMLLLKLNFALVFILCGLDHRHGWSRHWLVPVPTWLTLLALGGIVGCQFLFIQVTNANSFAASVIQVEAGQRIADTGPYRWVRHPMYAISILYSGCTPLALGSFIVWPAFVLIIPILVWRLLNEEKVLRRKLPGYADYCQRTRYRLLPRIW